MKPIYNTKIFTDIYDSYIDFHDEFRSCPFSDALDDTKLEKLFYLLYAYYGNSPIANLDEEQFKFKLWSVIFKFGPTWSKRLDIQEKLRNLTEEELITGTKAINNHAYNPSTAPSTAGVDEVLEINDQSTQTIKKSKIEAYGRLWDMLASDVTTEFLNRFKTCFKSFVMPENPVLYESEE